MMDKFSREMNEYIAGLNGGPFATYLEYQADAVAIDEAIERLKISLVERKAKGLCAVALNYEKVKSRMIMTSQAGQI